MGYRSIRVDFGIINFANFYYSCDMDIVYVVTIATKEAACIMTFPADIRNGSFGISGMQSQHCVIHNDRNDMPAADFNVRHFDCNYMYINFERA